MDMITAKTGRVIECFESELLTPSTSATSAGKCLTDKFDIDAASIFQEGTAYIEQIDIIQKVTSGLATPNTKLFLCAYDFSAQSAGSTFSIAPDDADLTYVLGMIPLAGTWQTHNTTHSIQNNININRNIKTGASRMIYGQLVNDGAPVFDATATLKIRIWIRKD